MKIVLSIALTIISLLNTLTLCAENRYNSFLTQDGILYFITPERLKVLKDLKFFQYDMTMLSWTDSITINFTFESNSMQAPENLNIVLGDHHISCKSWSLLFTDIKKNNFEIRVTTQLSRDDIFKFIESTHPPIFQFIQSNIPRSATYKPKLWKKERMELKRIFTLYNQSK